MTKLQRFVFDEALSGFIKPDISPFGYNGENLMALLEEVFRDYGYNNFKPEMVTMGAFPWNRKTEVVIYFSDGNIMSMEMTDKRGRDAVVYALGKMEELSKFAISEKLMYLNDGVAVKEFRRRHGFVLLVGDDVSPISDDEKHKEFIDDIVSRCGYKGRPGQCFFLSTKKGKRGTERSAKIASFFRGEQ